MLIFVNTRLLDKEGRGMTKIVPMSWHVYLLRCADGTLYCGITTDLGRRVAEHNGELPGGARYTRGRRPVALAASAAFPDRSAAASTEWRVKRVPKARKVVFLERLAKRSGVSAPSKGLERP